MSDCASNLIRCGKGVLRGMRPRATLFDFGGDFRPGAGGNKESQSSKVVTEAQLSGEDRSIDRDGSR